MLNSSASQDRILLLDSLRGFALMGLFLVHMVEYFELYWYKPEQSIFNDFTFFLFGGKAYAVFAMLFGVSFFILMNNNAKRGIDFRARFVWRLTILLLFGFLHGLIYGGDILIILAIAGFFLIPLYKLSFKWLIPIMLIFLLHIPELIYYVIFSNEVLSGNPAHWAMYGPVLNAYANGSFTELIDITLWGSQIAKWTFMLESGRLSTIFGISILGFLLGRLDFFREVETYRGKLLPLLLVMLTLTTVLIIWKDAFFSIIPNSSNWLISNILNSYISLIFTLSGVLLFIFLFQVENVRRVLLLLAPAGKMSLTVYVTQSLVFVPFFYGFGFAAYEFIGQMWSFILGAILWGVQLAVAYYWNNHYYYGPLEWVWRAGTYLNFKIKFRKVKPV